MAHDVFISYSSKDRSIANAVCAILEEHRIRCWIAPRDTPAGDFGDAIVKAIGTAKVMVVVFSANANESENVKSEVAQGVTKGLIIIPFRIQNVIPSGTLDYYLSTKNWLDAYTPPVEKHIALLVSLVQRILSGEESLPTPPPPPKETWVKWLINSTFALVQSMIRRPRLLGVASLITASLTVIILLIVIITGSGDGNGNGDLGLIPTSSAPTPTLKASVTPQLTTTQKPTLTPIAISSSPQVAWVNSFRGSEEDIGYDVHQTTDGGFIITGYASSFGPGSVQVLLVKVDTSGNEQWSTTLGGPKRDWGRSVQQIADGGFAIVGYTDSFGAGEDDVYLIKTDALGNEEWSITLGGPDDDRGYDFQQTSDQGFIIVGITHSYGIESADVWLIKIDKSGNEEWSATFGGLEDDWGSSVQETSDGGFIVVGATYSYGSGERDVWLIKTDKSGNEEWSATFGGTEDDGGSSVQETSDGGFVVAGWTSSFGAGSSDVWMIKVGSSGDEQWNTTFGTAGPEVCGEIQEIKDGCFVIAGTTRPHQLFTGEVFVLKTDDSGGLLWNAKFGDSTFRISGDYSGHAVEQTHDGGLVIVGDFYDFDSKQYSVFLLKLS